MNAALSLVTFDEIIELITGFRHRASDEASRAAWTRLLDVAVRLAGAQDPEYDPTTGDTWYLTEIKVQGYQGIGGGEPLTLHLEPTPGLTVIHGPNGAGKSSIADAIETALQGHPRPSSRPGKGGNVPIWEREHCGTDASQADIELTLQSGSEVLLIRCCLGRDDSKVEWSARRRFDGADTEHDLEATGWRAVVSAFRPVFAYAVIEREVQLARDLQQFLERMLAFGSCFEVLSREVDAQCADAVAARQEWDEALREAKDEVARVDMERLRTAEFQVPDIEWPSPQDDPDEWLALSNLTESGRPCPEVLASGLQPLRDTAIDVDRAVARLEEAQDSVYQQLASPLQELHNEAKLLANLGDQCPVCKTQHVPWLESLGETARSLADFQEVLRACRVAISKLHDSAVPILANVSDVLAGGSQEAHPKWWRDTVVPVQTESARAGDQLTVGLRRAARDLADWIRSGDCEAAIGAASAEADEQRQWHRARRRGIDPFVAVWRTTRADAAQKTVWDNAKSHLGKLQTRLRAERADVLGDLTGRKVRQLLEDAGLSLEAISVQGRQASLTLVDHQKRNLKLSMLSAGQRNALLLAPMLAVADAGPFRFLVLDDPVHALDQVRVDRLAAVLSEVAKARRVIVFTHDERLKEHLIARNADCDVRSVLRDADSGTVTMGAQGEMWSVLLDDARAVLDTAKDQVGGVTLPPRDIVRGLCRQAIDNALRSLVIRVAVRQSRNPKQDLDVLDSAATTKKRMTCARGIVSSDSAAAAALDGAKDEIESYLGAWNRSSHGNEAASESDDRSLRQEVSAARRACSRIAAAD